MIAVLKTNKARMIVGGHGKCICGKRDQEAFMLFQKKSCKMICCSNEAINYYSFDGVKKFCSEAAYKKVVGILEAKKRCLVDCVE